MKTENIESSSASFQESRRRFLECLGVGGCLLGLSPILAHAQDQRTGGEAVSLPPESVDESRFVKEAMHYRKVDEGRVVCGLCPWSCHVVDGNRGNCKVRENRKGTYYTLVYSRAVSANIDPVEKKPFAHYLPGTLAMSIATVGCNIDCNFCQNWDISQKRPEQVKQVTYLPPEKVVEIAKTNKCSCVAYTYVEPTIFYEYMFDTAKEARVAGLGNVIVSNGFIREKPLLELLEHLTAVKIDLKGFTEDYYEEVCHGKLQPVLDTLKRLKKEGKWFELVNLIIPTLNDDREKLTEMCKWIAGELGVDVPIHFSRFHPTYKIRNLPQTPVPTLETAVEIAKEAGLRYPYVGNVPGHKYESTYCPKCGEMVIYRYGYHVDVKNLKDGCCGKCGEKIAGIWKAA